MRELTAEDTFLISGGFLASQPINWGGGTNTFGGNPYQSEVGADLRNQRQTEQDARAAAARAACTTLPIASQICRAGVNQENFRLQSREFTICMAEGGSIGPSSCGRVPTP
jgi:hypothetical protein